MFQFNLDDKVEKHNKHEKEETKKVVNAKCYKE